MSPLRYLTDVEAATILQAVKEEGYTLRDLTTNFKRPKLTSREALERRCASHPGWGCEVKALLERNAEAAQRRKCPQKKAQTCCSRGHPFNLENTRVRRRGRAICRECKICERERQASRGPLMKPEKLSQVKEALRRNLPASQFTQGFVVGRARGKGDPRLKVVDGGTYYRQRRLDPEFEALVQASLQGEVERRATRKRKKNSEEVYRWVRSLLPAQLPEDAKLEIASMVTEAWLQHRYKGKYFGKRNVPQALKSFVAEYNRMFPPKFRKFGESMLMSLDAQLFEDGIATVGDNVSQGLWDD